MPKRYIDANEAIEYFEKHRRLAIHKDDIVAYLANLPTADVQEVKHGRWIIDENSQKFQYYDGTEMYENVYCSVCYKWGVSDFAFCPHCGALMDDKEKKNA